MSKTLAMKFGLESGDTRTISLQSPKDDLGESDVSAAMAQFISAGNSFIDKPIKALKATLTEKDVTVLVNNEYD